MSDNERELGEMSALLSELKDDVASTRRELGELAVVVQSVREGMAEIRGGWKALTILSGLAGAFIGALVGLATHVGSFLVGGGK